MGYSTLSDCEANSTSTSPEQPRVLVVRKHHFLVRWSHWLNIPILLGLILSGISIYWASPIYQHNPDRTTGNADMAADIIYLEAWKAWLAYDQKQRTTNRSGDTA
jgi:hypothetical protein